MRGFAIHSLRFFFPPGPIGLSLLGLLLLWDKVEPKKFGERQSVAAYLSEVRFPHYKSEGKCVIRVRFLTSEAIVEGKNRNSLRYLQLFVRAASRKAS